MKLRLWCLLALVFALLFTSLVTSLPPASGRDICVCQPSTTYYHSSYSPASYAWSAPVLYVEIGPSTYQSSMWEQRNQIWAWHVSSSYRSSRSERRSGNRLSGHSTDHWSQQLNWGRP